MAAAQGKNTGLRLMLGGDVMLGRIVAEFIKTRGAEYPLGPLSALLRGADVTLVNLECAITDSQQLWPGAPKAFYFGAPPQAAQSLAAAGIDLVSLANNHTLDFDVRGLLDTLEHLRAHGIAYAGAGADIDAARAPAVVERGGIRFGLVAYCDHQEDFAATAQRAGIAYLDLDDEAGALAELRAGYQRLRQAAVDWPILSLHWGSNWAQRPSDYFVRLARAAIDMGYGILFGHSAHLFQGVEIYRGRPIIYAAGDLVDDYYVDPDFRNDRQLLFELTLTRNQLQRIDLHPVFIEECRVQPAAGDDFEHIARRMTALCAELGTRVQRSGNRLWIDVHSLV
ncbi:MAG: CapA family protein [Pseudomonadota bacterium]